MEAAGTSEMLVNFYQTTQCYYPEKIFKNFVIVYKVSVLWPTDVGQFGSMVL
jgi:hypothetical protein